MPCNSDYLNPHSHEIVFSRVACVLDELNGRTWTESDWDGYHPAVYGQYLDKNAVDHLVAEACQKCQALTPDALAACSLELQTWWRDHQRADAERLKREQQQCADAAAREAALAKLTPYERNLLKVGQ